MKRLKLKKISLLLIISLAFMNLNAWKKGINGSNKCNKNKRNQYSRYLKRQLTKINKEKVALYGTSALTLTVLFLLISAGYIDEVKNINTSINKKKLNEKTFNSLIKQTIPQENGNNYSLNDYIDKRCNNNCYELIDNKIENRSFFKKILNIDNVSEKELSQASKCYSECISILNKFKIQEGPYIVYNTSKYASKISFLLTPIYNKMPKYYIDIFHNIKNIIDNYNSKKLDDEIVIGIGEGNYITNIKPNDIINNDSIKNNIVIINIDEKLLKENPKKAIETLNNLFKTYLKNN